MSGFLLWRTVGSIGPSFNEAAQKLDAMSDVSVRHTLDRLQGFVINTSEAGIENVSKALPGWTIEREENKFT